MWPPSARSGGVGINMALRESYLSTGSGTDAFWIFMMCYAAAAVLTEGVRPPGGHRHGDVAGGASTPARLVGPRTQSDSRRNMRSGMTRPPAEVSTVFSGIASRRQVANARAKWPPAIRRQRPGAPS